MCRALELTLAGHSITFLDTEVQGKEDGNAEMSGVPLPAGCWVSTSPWPPVLAKFLGLQTHLPASAARQEPASPSASHRASATHHCQARAEQPGGGKTPTTREVQS